MADAALHARVRMRELVGRLEDEAAPAELRRLAALYPAAFDSLDLSRRVRRRVRPPNPRRRDLFSRGT